MTTTTDVLDTPAQPLTYTEPIAGGNPLARKIAAIAKQIGHVVKTGHNEDHNYDFASNADIIEAARGPMNEALLAILPSVLPETIKVTTGLGRNNNVILTTLVVQFTVVDGESGCKAVCNFPGAGSDTMDKGVYKAMTGATKYFYEKLFNIPTRSPQDEPEADIEGKQPPAQAAPVTSSKDAPGQTHAEKIAATKAAHAAQAASGTKPAPPVQQSAKPVASGTPVMVDSIMVKNGQNDKGPWSLYTIKFSGKVKTSTGKAVDSATTFSDTIANECESARDARTPIIPTIETAKNKRGYEEHTIVKVESAA